MSTNRKLKSSIRKQILFLLKNNGKKAFRAKEISKTLGFTDNKRYKLFREVLSELEASHQVNVVKGRLYQHKRGKRTHVLTGRLTVNPHRFGFVDVEGEEIDIFIPPHRMKTALDGDLVRVELAARFRGKDDQPEGAIIEVVERGRVQVVGTFDRMGHFAFVKPDDLKVTKDVYVPQDAFNGAKEGDKVVVSIDTFDDHRAAPEGRILSVLGPSDAPGVAVLALAMASGARAEFPDEVGAEADQIDSTIPQSEVDRRLDLRSYPIFTIDPGDAKDFDDAIHVIEMPSGNLEVGVHIADVSYYVKEDSGLDKEALGRGTSTYLVDRVIPMLPEKLSNEVCSLRPKEDKLTFSCILEVEPAGKVVAYRIEETIVHSHARLTYEQAQAIIDSELDHPLKVDVQRAATLGATLTSKRMKSGAVDFNIPEIRVELDDQDVPVRVYESERKPSNRLVEEFMLLANKAVAEHVGKQSRNPFVYRVHAPPDSDRIRNLSEYVAAFGYKLPHSDGEVSSADLNALLEEVRGSEKQFIIETAALQSMSKALYSTDNIGHYGLGFGHYSHFTSPIRRYPDLIAHRLLKRYAKGEFNVDAEVLANHCKHCSERERAATEAERESTRLKQVEFVSQHVGEEFAGVVVGVTKFGVFVKMTELLTEGLIHVRDMTDDFWEYDAKQYALFGSRSGRTIRLGDSVKVRIAAASVETRRIDLVFA